MAKSLAWLRPIRSGGGGGLRSQSAKGSEGGGRLQALGKIANEGFHRGMPEAVEAEEVHFLGGLFGGPFLEGHAIGSDENTGAIVAKTAVHENFLARSAAEEGEKLNELFVGWGRPATDGNVHEAHAERFGGFALPYDFVETFAAQIDDGGDAQFFQFNKAVFLGLCAAVENFGDFAGVVDSGDVQFLSVSGANDGRSGGLRGILGENRRGKEEKENEECWRAPHNKLDASSVA